jgi:enediyne biosynthesis protein E5
MPETVTGTSMTPEIAATTSSQAAAQSKPASALSRFFSAENRYLPPMFLTTILLVGQLSYGLLESFSRTALAIGVSMLLELALGRLFYGKFPHLASSYISGISVGILIRSPAFWPYALCGAISIMSKYVIRWKGRHLWNPSNFAICAMLLLAQVGAAPPDAVSTLSIQWGNDIWPLLIVWTLGAFIMYRVKLFHITATYVVSFLAFAALRSLITGHVFLSEVSPITGPMYQLFIFFMITDPRTTVKRKWAQCLVAFLVAAMEMALRLAEIIHAPFYALTIVGPLALAIEIWRTTRKQAPAKT